MGPRRWSRGRELERRARSRQRSGFNGATAMEPWKSWLHRPVPYVLRWRFNGATAMEPWKSYRTCPGSHLGCMASMGPRRWSRGRELHQRSSRGPYQRFNGATAMEPWKREELCVGSSNSPAKLQWGHGDGAVEEVSDGSGVISSGTMLQWGHGDGAVEENATGGPWRSRGALQWGHGDGAVEEDVPDLLVTAYGRRASMGPRRWSRGRESRAGRVRSRAVAQLQWGHGDGAVEECSAPIRAGWRKSWLQWGHGDGAVEEAPTRWHERWQSQLQWGHGVGALEEESLPAVYPKERRASMGPRQWSLGRVRRL